MAGSRPRASSEDIGTADKISSVTAKASHKKRKEAKKSKVQQAAVLADADHAPVQPPPEPPQVGNKDEAQLIRQRLGIKAEDAKSSQTRVGFQFSFSVAEACPDAQASDDDHHGGAAFQTNIQTEPTSVAEAPKSTKSINDKKKRLSVSLPGLPARDAQASSPLQPDESGFIPRRVFIGGMPFWYSEEEIRQCWLECGEISDFTMLTFPDTGNFRGIVFITFAAQEGFDAALKFDGDELDGKRLVVQRCKAPAQARRATVRDGNPNWEQSTPHAGRDHDAVECSPRGNGVTSGARGVEDRPGKKRHRRDMHLQVSEADASGEKSSDDAGVAIPAFSSVHSCSDLPEELIMLCQGNTETLCSVRRGPTVDEAGGCHTGMATLF